MSDLIKPCGMKNTGFYRMDMIPENTAVGYIYDDNLKNFRTNIYSIPIVGASDGGIFTNEEDMFIFWDRLINKKLLSDELTDEMLSPKVEAKTEGDGIYYGLGVYIVMAHNQSISYFITGGDPGIDFFSAYYPACNTVATALGNTEKNTFFLLEDLNKKIKKV